jgi:hypothetical protein
MTIKCSWIINAMVCHAEMDGKTDVVFNVAWERQGVDDNGQSASVAGETPIQLDMQAQFVPYADLTKTQVAAWVEAALGKDQLSAIDDEVKAKVLQKTQMQSVMTELPWA